MLSFIKHSLGLSNDHELLINVKDDLWIDYLLHEKIVPEKFINVIPEMPSEKVQLHFTGSSGRSTLMQALDFYNLAQKHISKENITNQQTKKLLDFGCGWGRITRMWLRALPGNNIYGVDPMQEMINLCKESIPIVNFYLSNPLPPMSFFDDKMFDFVTAYSVFSHLNETYLNQWFTEFSRVMKKDGLLFATTRSRSFIRNLQTMREQNKYAEYESGLLNYFIDTKTAYEEYDKGHIIHEPFGGGPLSETYYGETCIPESYFNNFTKEFTILEFVPELRYETNQACIILKKK